MGLEFRLDDALAPSRSSTSQNLQPTFSSCAAAAGKVAGALSQASAFNAARAPLRHKEAGVGGSPDALLGPEEPGAGCRLTGGKSGGWDGWEERRGRADLSAGAGCQAANARSSGQERGREEKSESTYFGCFMQETGGTRMASIIQSASLCHWLLRLSISC